MCVYRSRPRRIQATAKYDSLGELAIYLSTLRPLSLSYTRRLGDAEHQEQ